jgi:hypothetical protein
MYKNILIGLILISSFASAGNGIKSELSHFVGGLGIVGLVAYIIFNYFPKYRSKSIWIGFWVSMVYVFVDQTLDYFKYGEFFDQLLDFMVHLAGSALAVFIGYKIIKNK